MSKEHQPTEAGEFNGKRILVTGVTRGIGGAIIERLVGSGGTIPTV